MNVKTLLAGASLALGLSLVGAASAGTVSIDFASLPGGTTITNQYEDVTFSLAGGLASGDPQIAYYSDGYHGGLSNSPNAGQYPTADSLVATFATPVSGLSFTFDNEGFNGNNAYYVYDSSNNLIASGALDGQYPTNQSVTLGNTDISKVVWSNGEGTDRSWTQAVATLEYTTSAAPEPASWALMIVGVGGMGAALRTRRRKVAAAG